MHGPVRQFGQEPKQSQPAPVGCLGRADLGRDDDRLRRLLVLRRQAITTSAAHGPRSALSFSTRRGTPARKRSFTASAPLAAARMMGTRATAQLADGIEGLHR